MALSDIDQVLAIEQRSFPTPWSKKAFISEITDNIFASYMVVEKGDKIVGYGGMWVFLDEAHITNIAVAPENRRTGIGEFILKQLIATAVAGGAKRMTLEVRASNHAAQRLYEKMGFERKGLRKGYYTDLREDAIIMWKDDLVQEGASGRASSGH